MNPVHNYIGSRSIRVPHGNGWFTFVRGARITRRQALRVLLFGSTRGRIESVQSDNGNTWRDES